MEGNNLAAKDCMVWSGKGMEGINLAAKDYMVWAGKGMEGNNLAAKDCMVWAGKGMEGINLAAKDYMVRVGKDVGPTVPAPKDVVGTRLDRDCDVRLYVAERFCVCRRGNHMAGGDTRADFAGDNIRAANN